jgi:hypothetical protein
MHSHEVSEKRSFDLSQSYPGHQIAVLGHPHEVKCTVRFSNCKPVDEDDDDQTLPARQEVPCPSLSVDKANKDENEEYDDDADEKDDNTPPEQLQQRPQKKSKLVRSGNGSLSAAVMKIFFMSQDSVDLEKPTKSHACNYVGCNEEDAQAFGDRRQCRGRQSIGRNHQKKDKRQPASSRQ